METAGLFARTVRGRALARAAKRATALQQRAQGPITPLEAVARVRPIMERQISQMVRLIDDLLDIAMPGIVTRGCETLDIDCRDRLTERNGARGENDTPHFSPLHTLRALSLARAGMVDARWVTFAASTAAAIRISARPGGKGRVLGVPSVVHKGRRFMTIRVELDDESGKPISTTTQVHAVPV